MGKKSADQIGLSYNNGIKKVTDFESLFLDNPAPMYIWEFSSGQLTGCNNAALSLYGYEKEAFLKMNIRDIRPPEEVTKVESLISNENNYLNFGKKAHFGNWIHKKKSGEKILVEIKSNLIDFKGKKSCLVVVNDISELIKTEEALKISENEYKKLFNSGPLPKWIYDLESFRILNVNDSALAQYGYSKEEFLNMSIVDLRPKQDIPKLYEAHLNIDKKGDRLKFGVYTHIKKDGKLMKMDITGQKIDYQGKKCIMVTCQDVTKKEMQRNLEWLEMELLENSISNKSDLQCYLSNYLSGLEKEFPHMMASILKVKDGKVWNLAGPSLPKAYLDAIHGAPIGPKAGSCGTSAYIKKIVIVSDINKDPLWADYKDLALSFDLLSCWSQPVFNSDYEVIATFACYTSKVWSPSEDEMKILERSASLLSLILENHQKNLEIKASNERYKYVTLASKHAIYDWDFTTGNLYWGKGFETLFGYAVDSLPINVTQKETLIHNSDLQKVKNSLGLFLSDYNSENWKAKYRLKKANGEFAFVEERAFAVRDTDGKVNRMIGVLSDITKETVEEQLLKLTESVVKNTSDAVLITDAGKNSNNSLKVIYTNAAFSKITGYSAEEIFGKSPEVIIRSNSNPSENENLRELMKKGKPFDINIICYKKNQEEFWNSISASPVLDEKGDISQWIFIQRDISEYQNELIQKRLLSEIDLIFNKNENLTSTLNLVLRHLANFGEFCYSELWLLSPDKQSLNLISNYSREEKIDFFVENKIPVNSFSFGKGLPGIIWEKGKFEIWENLDQHPGFIRKNEAQKTGLNKALGIPLKFNGEVTGVLIFLVNENYRKLHTFTLLAEKLETFLGSELHRKQLEHQLSGVFNASPDIICIAGLDGYFKKINPAAIDLLEYSENELMTKQYHEFIHPEDNIIYKAELESLLHSKKIAYTEIRLISKSGKSIWFSWSSIFSQEEGLIYAIAKNISKQKELQELLENATNLSKIGGWEIDFINEQLIWSPMTMEIHELDEREVPSFHEASNFYLEENQAEIRAIFKKSIEDGKSFQFDRPIITAKGNEKWVRCIGKPEYKDGICHRMTGSFQDIHSQKIAEINLNRSIQAIKDYKKALDQSFNLTITDLQGVALEVNDHTCALSGYTREELIGTHTRINKSGYHPKSYYQNMWQKISKGEIWRGDLKNLNKKGEEYWVDSIIAPLKDEKGKIKQYLAIRIDITEKKKAEESLLKSYAEKEDILESIGDAFFNVDEDWKITYWNKKSEEIFAVKKAEIIGKSILSDFQNKLELAIIDKLEGSKIQQKTCHFEHYFSKSDQWFEISVYPNKKGLSVYFRDITKQKKYLEQIWESNNRFEKVSEATNDAIWDWDITNDTIYWGGGFKVLFGHEVPKVSISTKDWLNHIHPEDAPTIKESLKKSLKNKNVTNWTGEYRFEKKDGKYAFVVDRGVIMRNSEGNPVRMVGAMADLSRQKEYEESLENLNINLRRQARDLEISNSELEQFAYIASHDLQEPLRMVTSFLTQLEKKYAGTLDTKAIQYIGFAVDGAKRMRQIILDLLDYSRVGKVDTTLQRFDLDEIVKEVLLLQKKIINETGAIIVTTDLPSLNFYPSPFIQVFNNLINNALKYSREGIRPEIQISGKEFENEWVISVRDNGIGIEKEYFDKIFVIFQRLHKREEFVGTGMGLSIVKKIIENLGGKIWVESIVGEGSTFNFSIPKTN
ncbi:PAS domain S-box protein [Aquiflexum sp. LQ15W]|uniref:PAS domain S-box protein n=1 Tax=Cognataquiflexum nitidum TaxID=2922272 RepID=UPI001F1356B4|nr:PAS domain S-box protein [Cognataquiflexum nitidum]MCH6201553.1 PAS domain S-box protein [Cognataquiflexum nitidum]